MWIAPQATTTWSASTVSQPPPSARASDRAGAPPVVDDHLGARLRIRRGAGRPRARGVAQADMLLRGGRAPEAAHSGADAAARVAPDEVAAPSERVGAALHDEGVLAGAVLGHLRDVQLALDAAEVGIELIGVQLVQAEALAPHPEHRVRRAEARARVDHRGAADSLPERQDDRRIADGHHLARVAIEDRRHLARPGREVVGREVPALLEHHDVHAALGQLLRHDRATRAGPDDTDVALHGPLAGEPRAVLDARLDRRRGLAPVAVGIARRRTNAHGRPSRSRSSRPRATFASAS